MVRRIRGAYTGRDAEGLPMDFSDGYLESDGNRHAVKTAWDGDLQSAVDGNGNHIPSGNEYVTVDGVNYRVKIAGLCGNPKDDRGLSIPVGNRFVDID